MDQCFLPEFHQFSVGLLVGRSVGDCLLRAAIYDPQVENVCISIMVDETTICLSLSSGINRQPPRIMMKKKNVASFFFIFIDGFTVNEEQV